MPTMISGFRGGVDSIRWRARMPATNVAAIGTCLAADMRNTEDRLPFVFANTASGILESYAFKNDGWRKLITNGSTTMAAGACIVVAPSRGPRGTIGAGGTTTSVALSTALPTGVGVNQLADRGDTRGFLLRIIDNGSGGSGQTAEVLVLANTSGTTPTISFAAIGFTPVTGSAYEFLSGRVYMLGSGALGAGSWKSYDVLTAAVTALTNTNLPATVGTDSAIVCLDEGYVPSDCQPGEGFVLGSGTGGVNSRALTATASAAGTITGQAAGGDATVLANEFRNFQIRIVKDVSAPTAVGQRRRITSHTAGASPVYTLTGNWTVTPSSNAQFVIEYSNEILLRSTASANVYTYAQDTIGTAQTGDTWSTATYSAMGAVVGAGVLWVAGFGIPTTFLYGAAAIDPARNFRWSQINCFHGGNTGSLSYLDIAGGANGSWANSAGYGGAGQGFLTTTGSCGAYDAASTIGQGRYFYVSLNGGQSYFRFNVFARTVEAWATVRFVNGSQLVGGRVAVVSIIDGATKVGATIVQNSSGREIFQCLNLS